MKRKAGRPKKIINYPITANYHYILYDLIDKKTNKVKRALGATEAQAKSTVNFDKMKIRPTKLKELTDKFGHNKTHLMLKKYGNQWICKEGKIFFG